ncbi:MULTISPECIES: flagellar brake protein [Undibacterium]|jgi:c-di-GMP-binding flagellar brake protein YcgR|uniref:Flagellar brake protein n=1 Tax=Undibacterium umbellatum TaxID=2762300 RepID=A0ABR6Z3D4_9BURK|nr:MULTISPECIES: flagellar brake protein [Undibacterium]MBC3906289.1 flagellar brake protein [Undibacterium umbellatum]MDP1977974.1 flagellar brake protein [Undibacterium sp.]
MGGASGLMPIKHAEISVGQTVPWAIYDEQGHLLMASGVKVESQHQLDGLLEHGYCNPDAMWDTIPSKMAPISKPVSSQPGSPGSSSSQQDAHKDVLMELDSVRWNVGEILYLQVHDHTAVRYTVKLIGFVKNMSIMVTAPTVDGKAVIIRDGQTFIVRAFPGKKAYAFTASAIKSVYSPHPYLHISYPKQVRCTTIRQGSRAAVKIIASLTIGDPEQTAAATIGDLSMGGASGVIKKAVGKKGDLGIIKFKVSAAGNDEYLCLNVILRSQAPTENGLEYRHGFEFIDVSAQSKLILSAFVHQTLAEMD